MSDSSPFDDQFDDSMTQNPAESSPFETNDASYEPSPFEEKNETETDNSVQVEDGEQEENDPFADVPVAQSTEQAPGFDEQSFQQQEEEQETPLSIWERERAEVLRERQAKADAEKDAQIQTAREEIAKFYADAEAKLEKTKKTNRADEKNYRTDTAAVFANGTKWEKVNKLVNLAPKPNEKPGSSRVERYRKLLTQLKSEKPKKTA